MKRTILFAAILMVMAKPDLTGLAQTGNQTSGQRPAKRAAATSISGRVVNEIGQPMPNARVSISGTGRQAVRRTINTDETGSFVVDGLPRGSYGLFVQVGGYVFSRDPRDPTYYRPGDRANLVVKKGAVITGTVTNSSGEPVVGVRVGAIPVRDAQGRLVPGGPGTPRYTDDRGVYRLFGLAAGTYIVAAAPKSGLYSLPTAYDDDVPTYYPSSTRDTAAEVPLRYGDEATGIDIRYRGERGYAISGAVAESSTTESRASAINILLMRASNDALEAQAYSQPRAAEQRFGFYGVPDGDYYLIARRAPSQSDDGALSRRMQVKVRGHDVTGLQVSLLPCGSVAGRILVDAAAVSARCETKQPPSTSEALITVRRSEADRLVPLYSMTTGSGAPGEQGDFLFQVLEAAHYRLETRMLDEAWYVRAITLPGPTNTPVDASRNGFDIRPGQRINGIRIVVADGAASLEGRVVGKEGAALPDRLRVHLAPAGLDSADDTLRFAEAEVQSDGTFKLGNLAPGRYWIIARQASEEQPNVRASLLLPLAWTATDRAALRREAEAANITVDLKPCQHAVDYKLEYLPPRESPKQKHK